MTPIWIVLSVFFTLIGSLLLLEIFRPDETEKRDQMRDLMRWSREKDRQVEQEQGE